MRRRLFLAAGFLLGLGHLAHADWSFNDSKTMLMLEDEESGGLFLSFECRSQELAADYSTLFIGEDLGFDALPRDLSVRLEITVKGRKPQSFPVVLDAEDGSPYSLGGPDARVVWDLLADGSPFTAALRAGKLVAWRGPFGSKGYDVVKDQLATFCPPRKDE